MTTLFEHQFDSSLSSTTTVELKEQIDDHPLLFFQTMDINNASADDLQSIPRIGPVLAGRIADYREQNGSFEQLEDLQQVQGIGEKTVIRLHQYLHVAHIEP